MLNTRPDEAFHQPPRTYADCAVHDPLKLRKGAPAHLQFRPVRSWDHSLQHLRLTPAVSLFD